MIWAGIAILTLGLLWSIFKGYVVWDIAHDVFGGGGAPTLDFPIICPIPVAVGITMILKGMTLYPFPWFGIVVYLCLAVSFGFLLWLFDHLSEPERQRQLRAIQERASRQETHAENVTEGNDEGREYS